jgi:hypothetical protein
VGDLGSFNTKLLEGLASKYLTPALLQTNLSLVDQNYLAQHGTKYVEAYKGIEQLVQQGTLVTGVPIKLQTMAEKRHIVKNFDECVETYNKWVNKTGVGTPYTNDELISIANAEVKLWYNEVPENLLLK